MALDIPASNVQMENIEESSSIGGSGFDDARGGRLLSRVRTKSAREIKDAFASSGHGLNRAESHILDLLQEWDTTGDGQYSVEEVLLIAQKYRTKEAQVHQLGRVVVCGAILISLLLLGILFVALAADEMSKDSRPNGQGTLMTRTGQIVGAAQIYQTDNLDRMRNMSARELAQVEFVSFDVAGVHHTFKVVGVVRRDAAVDVYFGGTYLDKMAVGDTVEVHYRNGSSQAVDKAEGDPGRRLGSVAPWMHLGAVGIAGRWDSDKLVVGRKDWWSHPGGFR